MLYLTAIVVDNINSKIIHLNDDLHQAKQKVNNACLYYHIYILIFIHFWMAVKVFHDFPRFLMNLRAPPSPSAPRPQSS